MRTRFIRKVPFLNDLRKVSPRPPPNLNLAKADEPAAPSEEVPEWWKVYEGLSDEEIDRLDQAIRQRANLTRVFE